jgi:predicted small secreted protein
MGQPITEVPIDKVGSRLAVVAPSSPRCRHRWQRVKIREHTGLDWRCQRSLLGRDDRIIVFVADEIRHLFVLVHNIERNALLVVVMVVVAVRLAGCTKDNTLRGYKAFVVFTVDSITDF